MQLVHSNIVNKNHICRKNFQLKAEDLRISLQKLEEEEKRYIVLWRSVINQAFADLKSKSHKLESIKLYYTAKKFLTTFNEDFLNVCCMAQLEPYSINKKAWKIINEKFSNKNID